MAYESIRAQLLNNTISTNEFIEMMARKADGSHIVYKGSNILEYIVASLVDKLASGTITSRQFKIRFNDISELNLVGDIKESVGGVETTYDVERML